MPHCQHQQLTPTLSDGVVEIPIENRSKREITHIQGLDINNKIVDVKLCPAGVAAPNPAFDVTPAKFITGLITEKGVQRP